MTVIVTVTSPNQAGRQGVGQRSPGYECGIRMRDMRVNSKDNKTSGGIKTMNRVSIPWVDQPEPRISDVCHTRRVVEGGGDVVVGAKCRTWTRQQQAKT